MRGSRLVVLGAVITARLSRDIGAALALPALRDGLEKRGAVPRSSSPEKLREIVRNQFDFWRTAVRNGWVPRE